MGIEEIECIIYAQGRTALRELFLPFFVIVLGILSLAFVRLISTPDDFVEVYNEYYSASATEEIDATSGGSSNPSSVTSGATSVSWSQVESESETKTTTPNDDESGTITFSERDFEKSENDSTQQSSSDQPTVQSGSVVYSQRISEPVTIKQEPDSIKEEEESIKEEVESIKEEIVPEINEDIARWDDFLEGTNAEIFTMTPADKTRSNSHDSQNDIQSPNGSDANLDIIGEHTRNIGIQGKTLPSLYEDPSVEMISSKDAQSYQSSTPSYFTAETTHDKYR